VNISADQENRREHRRVRVRVPVELRREGNEVPIGCATSDISVGGCYIEMMFALAKDTKLDITMIAALRYYEGHQSLGTMSSRATMHVSRNVISATIAT
jgi:hypothetical protein